MLQEQVEQRYLGPGLGWMSPERVRGGGGGCRMAGRVGQTQRNGKNQFPSRALAPAAKGAELSPLGQPHDENTDGERHCGSRCVDAGLPGLLLLSSPDRTTP